MRFLLTLGIDVPPDHLLSRTLMDEDAVLADLQPAVLADGVLMANDVTVIEVEVVDDDE